MAYLGPPPARTPVTSAQITDASVTAAKLATDSVTTAKITAANVTTAKITDANVTTAKIADDAVTTDKVGALTTLATNIITETTGGTGVTIDGVLVKDTDVSVDEIFMQGQTQTAVVVKIYNNSGTMQHNTFGMARDTVLGDYASAINGASVTLTTTPTGTDGSTDFATGWKIGSARTDILWADTGNQVRTDTYVIATIFENRTGTDVVCNFTIAGLDINGVNWRRPSLSHVTLNGNVAFALNTSNIAHSKSVSTAIYGWLLAE